MSTPYVVSGLPVIPAAAFPPPRMPTVAEDARRLVRHGLADVLDWLGEPVGPRPGERVHTIVQSGGALVCHPDTAAHLRRGGRS